MVVATAAFAREKVNLRAPGFDEVECPAASGSNAPFLHTTAAGRVTLSWVEPAGDGHRLRFATWRDSAWGKPHTVTEGTDWFVNWADVPSVIADDNGRMAAHWLEKSGDDTYAYDVRVSQSFDGGDTWGEPITPHRDGTQTEHGFASLILHNDYLHLVWLDGRKYADEEEPDETTLRAARIDPNGTISGEVELDGRTCDCCPTAVAPIDGGFIVVYRDRSPNEIRDIYAVRYVDGKWKAPKPVADDGWKINGCPVNGPAVASLGSGVYVAWFTMRGDRGVVRQAHSSDDGRTFTPAVDVSDMPTLGRVALANGPRLSTRVAWLATSGDEVRILSRGLVPGSVTNQVRAIANTTAARSSGYPRIVQLPGERTLAVWTETGETLRLRTGVLARPSGLEDIRSQ
jgi:hypothetical protein